MFSPRLEIVGPLTFFFFSRKEAGEDKGGQYDRIG
jgi:hypothetical protein